MGVQPERRRIGAYRVVKSLEGHGREVYVARRPAERRDRHYLLALFDVDESQERELEGEVYRCMELDHPAVASFVEMFVEADRIVLVLQGLQGVPLNRLLDELHSRGERLDDGAVIHIGVALLGALNCAHTATNDAGMTLPLVHAQLGPHQLLAGWNGEVKLLGLGLSTVFRLAAGLEPVPALAEPYLAPEVRRGGALTVRANVHSAAVLIAGMLSSRPPPAAGKSWPSLAELRPDLPPRLVEALDVALKTSLLERRITCAALLQALEASKLADPSGLIDKLAPLRESISVDGSALSAESFPPSQLSDVPAQSIPVLMSTPPEADDDEFALSEAPTQLMARPKAAIDAVVAAAKGAQQEVAGSDVAEMGAEMAERPPRPPPRRAGGRPEGKALRAVPGIRPRKATLIMGSPSAGATDKPPPAELAAPLTPRSPGVDPPSAPKNTPSSRKKLQTPGRGWAAAGAKGVGERASSKTARGGTDAASPQPPRAAAAESEPSAADVMDAALGEDIDVSTSEPPVESLEPSTTRQALPPEEVLDERGVDSKEAATQEQPVEEQAVEEQAVEEQAVEEQAVEEQAVEEQAGAPADASNEIPVPPALLVSEPDPPPSASQEARRTPAAFAPPSAFAPSASDEALESSGRTSRPRWLVPVVAGVAVALAIGFAFGRFSASPTSPAASGAAPAASASRAAPAVPSATADTTSVAEAAVDAGEVAEPPADAGAEAGVDAAAEDAGLAGDRGFLTVTSSRAGAVIYVEGERVGSAGAKLEVRCGTVTVRLGSSQPGVWLSAARAVDVPCGAATTTFIPASRPPGASLPTPKKGSTRPKGWSPDDI